MPILHKGLWNNITLDGVGAVISRRYDDKGLLMVVGPNRVPGDVYSAYTPLTDDGLPKTDDESDFAVLYRRLTSLVQSNKLEGPYGENHPAVFRRFEYFFDGEWADLLVLLVSMGTIVKVTHIDHRGNDAEVEEARRMLAQWIDADTKFKQNPREVVAEEHERRTRQHQRLMKLADERDKRLKRYVLFPVLLLILAGAFWFNPFLGAGITCFILFAWWWINRPARNTPLPRRE